MIRQKLSLDKHQTVSKLFFFLIFSEIKLIIKFY